jgi:hypothetical protein
VKRLLCLLALVACSGRSSAPAHPEEGPRASGSGLRASDNRAQSDEHQPIDSRRNDKCVRLIDRVVTLAIAERPAEQKPTDEERTNLVKQLEPTWAPKCEAMTSKGFDCAVTAQTLAELDRCGG